MLHNHILTTIVASHRTAKTLNQFLKCIEPQIKLILLLHYHILTNARRERESMVGPCLVLASLDRCSGVGGFSSCTKGGGRPQDLQDLAWDETKEEKQRAPWAPSLPNLGSSPRATHLQMGGGCGSSARIWQEEGGVEGGRRLRPVGGVPPRASRRRWASPS